MRYEKYLFEESEKQNFDNIIGVEGLNILPTGISKDEQCKYLVECRIIEAVFATLCELFDMKDVGMETTNSTHSFCLIIKEETEFNNQKIMRSPELSREKLKDEDAKDISEAIIDLIKERNTWSDLRYCKTLHVD